MTPLRLLQVEDTDHDAALVQLALTRAGYDIVARRVDCADALRRELLGARWDLVIADYAMPRFSGKKALAVVREQHPDLPFIFVSATIGEDNAVAAMETQAVLAHLSELGCDSAQGYFLAKPGPAAEITAWMQRRAVPSR